jgi:hypothetical protein
MCSPLRPWRDHDRSNTLTDRAVVEYVRDCGPARPRDIARSRFRENVIRLQCRYLCACGILTDVARETYSCNQSAIDRFERVTEATASSEFVDAAYLVPDRRLRITDFAGLDLDYLRRLNRNFLDGSEFTYGCIRGNKRETRRYIDNIEEYRVSRFVREFPRHESLCRQCAHWVRALVGLHYFPDANHRTAMNSLYGLLSRNGLAPDESDGLDCGVDHWPFDSIDIAVTRSKLLRSYHCNVKYSTLWERDELYQHWERYFRDNLLAEDGRSRSDVSGEFLDDVLEYSRRRRPTRWTR